MEKQDSAIQTIGIKSDVPKLPAIPAVPEMKKKKKKNWNKSNEVTVTYVHFSRHILLEGL